MIVVEVASKDAAEVSLAEHENMIQALAADRANEPLGEGILSRTVWGDDQFGDVHTLHAMPEAVALGPVAIAQVESTSRHRPDRRCLQGRCVHPRRGPLAPMSSAAGRQGETTDPEDLRSVARVRSPPLAATSSASSMRVVQRLPARIVSSG